MTKRMPAKRNPSGPYMELVDDRRRVAVVAWELMNDARLSPKAKLVGGALSGHFNAKLEARPSQDTLARICSCSVPTIKRALRELRTAGWLEVEYRVTGDRKRGAVFRLKHPTDKRLPKTAPSQIEAQIFQLSGRADEGSSMIPRDSTRDQKQSSTRGQKFRQTKENSFNDRADRSRETTNSPRGGEPVSAAEAIANFGQDWRARLAGQRKAAGE